MNSSAATPATTFAASADAPDHAKTVEAVDTPSLSDADRSLLAAFYRGDRGVGRRLYDRLLPVVDGTLYRVLGGRDADHADLVQASFEQLVLTLRRRSFAEQCSLSGWAAVVTCNLALTTLRARSRARKVIEPSREPVGDGATDTWQPGATLPDPERMLTAADELALVRKHLAAMDEQRTTALLLHAMGHSLEEIARLTHVSVAAAQSRLSRGRRELRARLQADAAPPGREDDARGTDGPR